MSLDPLQGNTSAALAIQQALAGTQPLGLTALPIIGEAAKIGAVQAQPYSVPYVVPVYSGQLTPDGPHQSPESDRRISVVAPPESVQADRCDKAPSRCHRPGCLDHGPAKLRREIEAVAHLFAADPLPPLWIRLPIEDSWTWRGTSPAVDIHREVRRLRENTAPKGKPARFAWALERHKVSGRRHLHGVLSGHNLAPVHGSLHQALRDLDTWGDIARSRTNAAFDIVELPDLSRFPNQTVADAVNAVLLYATEEFDINSTTRQRRSRHVALNDGKPIHLSGVNLTEVQEASERLAAIRREWFHDEDDE